MRVAYYSPLPPERSGIADYSALLLPALARRVEVVVAKRGARRPPRAAAVALYHVGNDPEAHGWIVRALERRRGVVVLHDFVLHHLVAGLTLAHGDGEGYLRALERDGGVVGRLLGHGVIDRAVPPLWEARPEEWPLASRVLDHAGGLVVHSGYVERRAREARYAGPIWRIPHPAWPAPSATRDPSLPLDRRPIVGCFGHLNASKRIPQLLEAFVRLRGRHPRSLLVLAGTVAPRFELDARLESLGLERGRDLVQLDYVDEPRLWALLRACDVCVSLRAPTMGETSGIALRALSAGRPLVVSDVGWFSELPDAVAAKVPVDEWEVDLLSAVLERLAEDDELRRRMGEAARRYAAREHDLERVAELYTAALEEAAGGALVLDGVVRELAGPAADVGLDDVEALAARLRDAGV